MKLFNPRYSLAVMASVSLAGAVQAAIPSYPNSGNANAASYSFTAVGNGPVTAYFAGSSASYGSYVGLSINGGPVTLWGLQNNSTAQGTSFVMGNVVNGDIMTFMLSVDTGNSTGPVDPDNPSYFLSSDETLNPGGSQHVYSTAYGGGDFGIPAGTYIGFEDITPLGDGDRDYNDNQFVFTGPGLSRVPEGGSAVAMLGFVLAGLGAVRRRIK